MQAVQRVIAYSENAGQEITAEFGIPAEEVCVVPLGVDATWFGHRKESDVEICRKLGLATPFFFSIATDFPHKNLPNLLDAYAMLAQPLARRRAPGPGPCRPHVECANGFLSHARVQRFSGRRHFPGPGLSRAIASSLPACHGPGLSLAV